MAIRIQPITFRGWRDRMRIDAMGNAPVVRGNSTSDSAPCPGMGLVVRSKAIAPGGTTPTNRRRTTPDDGPASRSCRNLRQDRDRDLNPKPRPLAGGAVDLDRAVHGSDAIAESSKARSPRGVGAADAVVGDLHRELPIGGADPNRDRRSLRILRCVGQGLG